MKKTVFSSDFHFKTLLSVVLITSFASISVSAETFYRCLDRSGNETLLDSPIEGQTCTPIQTYEDKKEVKAVSQSVASRDDKITKIIVKANQVFVPVTLAYDNTEETVHLLLDTGATSTMIHTEVADRLYIKPGKTSKTRVQVVGGSVIDAAIVRMDVLKVGPHSIPGKPVFIVPYEGPDAKFDGLLGFDVLGSFAYKIDFAKQIIVWE